MFSILFSLIIAQSVVNQTPEQAEKTSEPNKEAEQAEELNIPRVGLCERPALEINGNVLAVCDFDQQNPTHVFCIYTRKIDSIYCGMVVYTQGCVKWTSVFDRCIDLNNPDNNSKLLPGVPNPNKQIDQHDANSNVSDEHKINQ